MILPNNGKVVVIDDQPEDVEELISALSKEKVPFVHYKEEDGSDLPDTPIENVRLIFLDLELLTDAYVDPKSITGPIKTRLTKIIKPNTAYALVIWSKKDKENDYIKELLKNFNEDFKEYRPIFHTRLPKSDIIGSKDAILKIKKELETEIEKFKSFNCFLVWESLVNESSGKLTNELTSLYQPDKDWDAKTKFLLYKLAMAYSGKAAIGFTDIMQLKNALYTLTMTFTDNIENRIDKEITDRFKGLVSSVSQSIPNFDTTINKLLLISESSDDTRQPGNVFYCLDELSDEMKNAQAQYEMSLEKSTRLKEDDQQKVKEGIEKKFGGVKEAINQKVAKKKTDFNRIVGDAFSPEEEFKDLRKEALKTVKEIELNITPLCDYAQEKATLFRILPGVMIDAKFRGDLIKTTYNYVSDANFRIGDKDYLFLFDFRFLYSISQLEIEKRNTKYRVKQQLLSDIQVKLGAHINRAGVLYVA